MITVEDGFPQSGIGAELVSIVHETEAFDYLKGPVERVSAIDAPMPYAKVLEDQMVPRSDTVTKAVRKVMKYEWLLREALIFLKIRWKIKNQLIIIFGAIAIMASDFQI